MKLVIVAAVALIVGMLFGILVTAVLAAGKEEDELREKMWKEYEEQKKRRMKKGGVLVWTSPFFGRIAQTHVSHAPPIRAAGKKSCTKKSVLLYTHDRRELWILRQQKNC